MRSDTRSALASVGSVTIAVALLASSSARAELPALAGPDRPTWSKTAATVPFKTAQLELGLDWQHTAGPIDRFALAGSLRVGLPGPLELRIEGEQFVRQAAPGAGASTGFGDLVVGAKARLLDAQGYRPALALQPFVKLPTAPAPLGTRLVDFGLGLLVSQPLPLGVSVDLNLVPAFVGQPDPPGGQGGQRLSFTASASFGRSLSDAVALFVEPVWLQKTTPTGLDRYVLGAGAVWTLGPRLLLDVGLWLLGGGDPTLTLRSGFTARAF